MLQIENRTKLTGFMVDETRFNQIAIQILKDYQLEDQSLSLSFVSQLEIKKLNNTYRGINEVTDVLSFSSDGEIDPETGKGYLGDILICQEKAAIQAQVSGHSLENEIFLLLIHGLLHLLGFDHGTADEEREMWQVQSHYLEQFGIILGRNPGENFDF